MTTTKRVTITFDSNPHNYDLFMERAKEALEKMTNADITAADSVEINQVKIKIETLRGGK